MNRNQQLLEDMLFQVENRDNEFPVIDEDGNFKFPVLTKSGIREAWSVDENYGKAKYRGHVLEINDHGNVTVWMQFLNGNRREVASRV